MQPLDTTKVAIVGLAYAGLMLVVESDRSKKRKREKLGMLNFPSLLFTSLFTDRLRAFDNDHHTPDGKGISGYLHVMDSAGACAKAADYATIHRACGIPNTSAERRYPDLKVVLAFDAASGKSVPMKIVVCRVGIVAELLAARHKATAGFGWIAQYGIGPMYAGEWAWQLINPYYPHPVANSAALVRDAPSWT